MSSDPNFSQDDRLRALVSNLYRELLVHQVSQSDLNEALSYGEGPMEREAADCENALAQKFDEGQIALMFFEALRLMGSMDVTFAEAFPGEESLEQLAYRLALLGRAKSK